MKHSAAGIMSIVLAILTYAGSAAALGWIAWRLADPSLPLDTMLNLEYWVYTLEEKQLLPLLTIVFYSALACWLVAALLGIRGMLLPERKAKLAVWGALLSLLPPLGLIAALVLQFQL